MGENELRRGEGKKEGQRKGIGHVYSATGILAEQLEGKDTIREEEKR